MNDLYLTNNECYYPVTFPVVTPPLSIRQGGYWKKIVLTELQTKHLVYYKPQGNPGSQGSEGLETPRGVDHPEGAAAMATPAPSTQRPRKKPPTPRTGGKRKASTK